MKALPESCTSRLAEALIRTAALLLPYWARARYREEWMAELDEYRRESIAPIPPALRILSTALATRRGLRSHDRAPGPIMGHRSVIGPLHLMLAYTASIPGRLGERLFAMNDTEAYWQDWQISRTHGGTGRRYRDPRFDIIGQAEEHNQPAA
jgi:hypothetical protein